MRNQSLAQLANLRLGPPASAAKWAARTECSNGHRFTAETLHIDSRNKRCCRLCWSAKEKLRWSKRKLLKAEFLSQICTPTILKTRSWMDEKALPLVNSIVASGPDFMRDDIRQELLAMLWAGEIEVFDIAATAKKLRTAYYKDYPLFSKWGHRSLDAPISRDADATKLIEFIREDQRLWL